MTIGLLLALMKADTDLTGAFKDLHIYCLLFFLKYATNSLWRVSLTEVFWSDVIKKSVSCVQKK